MKKTLLLKFVAVFLFLQACGPLEVVDPEVQLPNTWKLYQLTVQTSSVSYAVSLAKAKYVSISSFIIDTEQLTFKADGTLEYLERGINKKGTWKLATDKKSVEIVDANKKVYNPTVVSITSNSVTFGSIKVDPRKRTSQYTYAESDIYYEVVEALSSIGIFDDSYSSASFVQLGAQFSIVK
jgi:hypothetical protein